MLYFILFLLLVWLALTVLGMVLKGLFWLTVLGIVLFLATAAWGWLQKQHR